MAYTHIDLRVYTVSLPVYPVKSRKSAEKPGKFCTNFTYETDRRFWYLTLTRLHGKLYRQIFTPRGVAQLVARLLWEQDAAGSSPVTSTRFNGMQSICMPFFIACTIFRHDSNLFSIAPRAEAAPNGCVLRVLSPRPRRCGRRIARSDFFKVTSHSLCHSSSSSTTRCAGLALDS